MTLAFTDPVSTEEFSGLVERLRANRLPPPTERRAIRDRAEASLEDIARELGVTRMTVCRWERGDRKPRPKHRAAYVRLLRRLATEFDASLTQE